MPVGCPGRLAGRDAERAPTSGSLLWRGLIDKNTKPAAPRFMIMRLTSSRLTVPAFSAVSVPPRSSVLVLLNVMGVDRPIHIVVKSLEHRSTHVPSCHGNVMLKAPGTDEAQELL